MHSFSRAAIAIALLSAAAFAPPVLAETAAEEGQRLFRLDTCPPGEIEELIRGVVEAADAIQRTIIDEDAAEYEKSPEEGTASLNDLMAAVDRLKRPQWRREGSRVAVRVDQLERNQTIDLSVEGEHSVLTSVVLGAAAVTCRRKRWNELARLAWQRNALLKRNDVPRTSGDGPCAYVFWQRR